MRVIRGFPIQSIVACFDEAAGGGDIEDIDAPCNAPAKSPSLHLSSVYWHSDFFQYELAMPLQTVPITHTLLAGRTLYFGTSSSGGLINGSTTPPSGGITVTSRGDQRTSNLVLVNHGLGYVPLCFVAYEGRMLVNGSLIQAEGGGQWRSVSAFATASQIGLREYASSNASDLPAKSSTYQVLVFRNPAPDPGRALFGSEGSNIVLGRGKIDTSKQYLRRVGAGDSPFSIDLGRTVDARGGRLRVVTGGQTTTEPGYTGSFTGSPSIQVGV